MLLPNRSDCVLLVFNQNKPCHNKVINDGKRYAYGRTMDSRGECNIKAACSLERVNMELVVSLSLLFVIVVMNCLSDNDTGGWGVSKRQQILAIGLKLRKMFHLVHAITY